MFEPSDLSFNSMLLSLETIGRGGIQSQIYTNLK